MLTSLPPLANAPTLEQRLDERVSQLARRRRKAAAVQGVDDREWPLVVARVGPDDDDDALVAVLDCISGLHLRGPFALVVDLRGVPPLTALRRRLLAAARAVDEQHFPGVCCARAVVVGDEETRRAMLVVSWLRPTQHPVEVFMKREDAIAWACSRLAGPRERAADT